MIPEELRSFIEQNCSGKEPSDLIMEAIGKKIEQLGANADEVLAFVEECAKGLPLEQKETERKRKEKELSILIEDICSAMGKMKASLDKESFMSAKADCELLTNKANLLYGDNQKIQMLKSKLEEEIREVEERFKTPIADRIMSSIILLIMMLFVICFYFIPLLFKGVRNCISSHWHKVIGKD